MSNGTRPSEEQFKYASILQKVGLSGLGLLIIGFFVYVLGLLPNIVPVNKIPEYWSMRVHEFVEYTGMPTGWKWVPLLNHGDVISFLGIVILSAATVICMVAVLPSFVKKKDTPYIVILIIQIVVLLLAASGMITGGH